MALTAERVTVSTVAVALNGADTGPSGGGLLVRAVGTGGTNDADLGASTVTAGTGFLLVAGGSAVQVNLAAGEQLYAIRTGGADATLHVIRTGG
jgi:hypothetical protein